MFIRSFSFSVFLVWCSLFCCMCVVEVLSPVSHCPFLYLHSLASRVFHFHRLSSAITKQARAQTQAPQSDRLQYYGRLTFCNPRPFRLLLPDATTIPPSQPTIPSCSDQFFFWTSSDSSHQIIADAIDFDVIGFFDR